MPPSSSRAQQCVWRQPEAAEGHLDSYWYGWRSTEASMRSSSAALQEDTALGVQNISRGGGGLEPDHHQEPL